VSLTGDLCGGPDCVCGTVTAQSAVQLQLDVGGSTFTLQRISDPDEPRCHELIEAARSSAAPILLRARSRRQGSPKPGLGDARV
jgi:hypothetical protein